MLLHLSIKNFLLLKELEVDFEKGLSVIIGQTGAGKSILLDAIKLVLGLINIKKEFLLEENATIAIEFNVDKNKPVISLLNESGIEFDSSILIRRIFKKNGSSKIFINDQPISLNLLKNIGINLLDFNSQGDQYKILNENTYKNIVDKFSQNESLLLEVRKEYEKFISSKKQYEKLVLEGKDKNKEIEYLLYNIKELEELNIEPDEENKLRAKKKQILNSEKLIKLLNTIKADILNTQSTLLGSLKEVNRNEDLLSSLNNYNDLIKNLEEGFSKVENIESLIREELNPIEHENIDLVQERLFRITEISRKHNCPSQELPQLLNEFRHRLENLKNLETSISNFLEEYKAYERKYCEHARFLSNSRKVNAKKLSENVLISLKKLHMEKARFNIIVESDEKYLSPQGVDKIIFKAAMNPGHPMADIEKVASGGELSRFLLALKVSFADILPVGTLIFDEIDTGVSGNVASSIADQLKDLSLENQVIVVTHSPQLISVADHHYKIEKVYNKKNNSTISKISYLTDKDKKEEIARLLSGHQISDRARELASELLSKD